MAVDARFVAELRNTARAAGVSDRVFVLDNPFELMPDARERLMSAADVFLHLTTGIEEASSLVVHEAMAYGLPVIATRWAGLGEVIDEGDSGFLIDTASLPVPPALRAAPFGAAHGVVMATAGQLVTCDWAAFVQRTVLLAATPELRGRMGEAARARMERQTLQMIARRYVDFFRQCAREAAAQDPQAGRFRPLVDLGAVLGVQGARPLPADLRLRPGNLAAADLVSARLPAPEAQRLTEAMARLAADGATTAAQLAAHLQTSAGADPGGPPSVEALASQGLLIARLINHGVIEPDG
jgi:hypothetical protein